MRIRLTLTIAALIPALALAEQIVSEKQTNRKLPTPNAILSEPDPTVGITFGSAWRYGDDQVLVFDPIANRIVQLKYEDVARAFEFIEYPVSAVPVQFDASFDASLIAGGARNGTNINLSGVSSSLGDTRNRCGNGPATTSDNVPTGQTHNNWSSTYHSRAISNVTNDGDCVFIPPSYAGQADARPWDGATTGFAPYAHSEMSVTKYLTETSDTTCPALSDGKRYKGRLGVKVNVDAGVETRSPGLGRVIHLFVRESREGLGSPVTPGVPSFHALTPEICVQPSQEACIGKNCFSGNNFSAQRTISYRTRGVAGLPLTGGQRLHAYAANILGSAADFLGTGLTISSAPITNFQQRKAWMLMDETCVAAGPDTYNCPDSVAVTNNVNLVNWLNLSVASFDARTRVNTNAGVLMYRSETSPHSIMMFDAPTKDFRVWANIPINGRPNVAEIPISYLSDVPLSSSTSGGGGSVTFPVISLSTDPASTYTNQPFDIDWMATGAVGCTAGGELPNFQGVKPVSGTQNYGAGMPVAGSYTLTLTCVHADGFTKSRDTVQTVEVEPPVVLDMEASPLTFVRTNTTTITWDAHDARTCVASGDLPGWAGSKGVSGSQTIRVNTAGTYTATLRCTRWGESTERTLTIEATPFPPITIANFSASPNPVFVDDSTQFSWATVNATTCSASGTMPNWAGSKATTGTWTWAANQAGSFEAVLTCVNPDRTASARVNLESRLPPPPTLDLQINPEQLKQGEVVTITWAPGDARRGCVANGSLYGWSGIKNKDGGTETIRVTNAQGDVTIGMTCTNAGGATTQTKTLKVDPPDGGCTCPPGTTPVPGTGRCQGPSGTFDCGNNQLPGANLSTSNDSPWENEPFTLTWACTNSFAATGSGPSFSGSRPTNGNRQISVSTPGAYDYEISCINAEGTASDEVPVTIKDAPVPVITFTAPNKVFTEDPFTVAWSVSGPGVASCTASGGLPGWSGNKAPSGSQNFTSNSAQTTTFSLSCPGYGGTGTGSATVTIALKPKLSFNLAPATIDKGQQLTLNWTTQNMTGCTATGGASPWWTGAKNTSGSNVRITPTTDGNFNLGLNCTGPEGGLTDTKPVLIRAVPIIGSFTGPANMLKDQSHNLSWSVTDATNCTAEGDLPGWAGTGAKPLSSTGFAVTPDRTGAFTARLTCTHSTYGTTTSRDLSVTVWDTVSVTLTGGGNIYHDESPNLQWTSTGAATCEAIGDLPNFSGNLPLNGSHTTPPATAGSFTARVRCRNPVSVDTAGRPVNVTWRPPSVTFSMTPALATKGDTLRATWSVAHAPGGCVASGAPFWTGNKPLSGNNVAVTANTDGFFDLKLTCTGAGGTVTERTVPVTVQLVPVIGQFIATQPDRRVGQNFNLRWSSTDATECIAGGTLPDWKDRGSVGTSGNNVTVPASTIGSYSATLTCRNTTYNTSATQSITVNAWGVVTTTLSAASTIFHDESPAVTWSAPNAVDCVAAGNLPGWTTPATKANSGTFTTAPGAAGSYTVEINCRNPVSNQTRTRSVTVNWRPPSVTYTISPATIDKGQQYRSDWSVTHAPGGCTASGASFWTGSKPATGTNVRITPAADGNFSLKLTCNGAGGTATEVTRPLTVRLVPNIGSFTAPQHVERGVAYNLSWSSTDATSCTAGGDLPGWSTQGSVGTSRSNYSVTSNTAGTYTATLTCTNSTYGTTDVETRTVRVWDQPTITFTVPSSAYHVDNITFTWNSPAAQTCSSSGSFPEWAAASRARNGSFSRVLNTTGTYTASITCTNPIGTRTENRNISVTWHPPVVAISNNGPINSGSQVTLNWSSTYATSCSASGSVPGWSGSRATAGSSAHTINSGSLIYDQTYNAALSCAGNGGSTSNSTSVIVKPPMPSFYIPIAAPGTGNGGQNILVRWDASQTTHTCIAGGTMPGWSGNKATRQGNAWGGGESFTLPVVTSDTTYSMTMTCSNDSGSVTSSTNVTVRPYPACGAAQGGTTTSPPGSDLCTVGSVTWLDDIANDGNYNWRCSYGGYNVNCSSNRRINGACNAAVTGGSALANYPANGCSQGTQSATDSTGSDGYFNWTCNGLNGGASASCSVASSFNGQCNSYPGAQSCYTPGAEACDRGEMAGLAYSSATRTWNWTCRGSNPGSSADDTGCSVARGVACPAAGHCQDDGAGASTACVAHNTTVAYCGYSGGDQRCTCNSGYQTNVTGPYSDGSYQYTCTGGPPNPGPGNVSYSNSNRTRSTASVTITYSSNGTWSVYGYSGSPVGGTGPGSGTWLPSGESAGNYEIRVQLSRESGVSDFASTSAASWASLSSNQNLVVGANYNVGNGAGEAFYTATISMRKIGQPATEVSRSVNLWATSLNN